MRGLLFFWCGFNFYFLCSRVWRLRWVSKQRPRISWYWKYVRPYDVAIFGHLLVYVTAKLLSKNAGRYVYWRVF